MQRTVAVVAAMVAVMACARRAPVTEGEVAAAAAAALDVVGPEAEARYRAAMGDVQAAETPRAREALNALNRALIGAVQETPLFLAAARYAMIADALLYRCRMPPGPYGLNPRPSWHEGIAATHEAFVSATFVLRAELARLAPPSPNPVSSEEWQLNAMNRSPRR